jgi:hypothetical protein
VWLGTCAYLPAGLSHLPTLSHGPALLSQSPAVIGAPHLTDTSGLLGWAPCPPATPTMHLTLRVLVFYFFLSVICITKRP